MKSIRLVLMFAMLVCGASGFARADQLGDALKAAQRGDFAVAVTLWLPLARQGNVRAQYDMGVMYQHGQGVAQDYKNGMASPRHGAMKTRRTISAASTIRDTAFLRTTRKRRNGTGSPRRAAMSMR